MQARVSNGLWRQQHNTDFVDFPYACILVGFGRLVVKEQGLNMRYPPRSSSLSQSISSSPPWSLLLAQTSPSSQTVLNHKAMLD
jgi:hypothetical protein